jgi:hypothetical protein
LSWSHDTCAFEERLDRYPVRAYRDGSLAESEGVAFAFLLLLVGEPVKLPAAVGGFAMQNSY